MTLDTRTEDLDLSMAATIDERFALAVTACSRHYEKDIDVAFSPLTDRS